MPMIPASRAGIMGSLMTLKFMSRCATLRKKRMFRVSVYIKGVLFVCHLGEN